MKLAYVACNGTLFDTEDACVRYENNLRLTKMLSDFLHNMYDLVESVNEGDVICTKVEDAVHAPTIRGKYKNADYLLTVDHNFPDILITFEGDNTGIWASEIFKLCQTFEKDFYNEFLK